MCAMKKITLMSFITAAVVGSGFLLLTDNQVTQANMAPPKTAVTVLKAYRQPIYDSAHALGTTMANESVDITATVTKKIQTISFNAGDRVSQGDIIAVLEHEQEQIELARAQQQLAEHQRELSRLSKLLLQQATSQRTVDERKTQVALAKETIRQIQSKIQDHIIRAPFAGVLGMRDLSVGALVRPGDVIATLDDINTIKIDFEMPATFLAELKSGDTIRAHNATFNSNTFKGHVSHVDTRVDPATRSVKVRAVIDNNTQQLKPGLLMQITLLKNQRQSLVVAEESIIQRQKDNFLLLVDPETFKVSEQKVELGTRLPGIAEVTRGINAGDLVITRGIQKVRPDQEVAIGEQWTELQPAG